MDEIVARRGEICAACDAHAERNGESLKPGPGTVWVVTDIGTDRAEAVLHYQWCRDVPPASLLSAPTTMGDTGGSGG